MSSPVASLPPVESISIERPVPVAKVVVWSVAAGILMAVLWSFKLVDSVIGDNVANTLLGYNAKQTAIAGTVTGLVFAFVSGLAGTFTACNIAMAAAVGPMSQASGASYRKRAAGSVRLLARPVGWLTLGMVTVSGLYGFIGVLLGDRLPQLSTAKVGAVPERLIQSSVVFGVIGLALIYLGLAAAGALPDIFRNRPNGRVLTLGALVGGFLIGRPYPLFNKLFHWAVDTHNPLYGAAAFILQSLGNIVVVTVIFALFIAGSRGRFLRWLSGSRRRTAIITAVLLIALGVFNIVYWDIRLPAMFGIGWFPTMPYNA